MPALESDNKPGRTVCNPGIYETTLRVRYAETDQMGVVYHSNYVIWFEVGRVEMLRQLGFTYREMERQDGICLAVVEARCRFKEPARYDDLILIRTRFLNVRDSLLHFGYEILRQADGALLAEGETIHMVLGRDFKRIQMPDKYRGSFLRAAGRDSE